MKKLFALILLALCATSSMAGTVTGTVTQVNVDTSGLTWVYMSANTGHAACAGSNPQWFVKDETSVAGKSQAAMLILAHASGLTVTIYGASTCTRNSGYEDISTVVIQ